MDKKVIVFQGDSITDCGRNREADGLGLGYPNMVTATLMAREPYRYICKNRGISGNRIVDLYARIKLDMINLKPDYLSILIGVNDVWHEISRQNGVDADKFEMVYSLLIEELQRDLPNLKIMILEPFVLPGSATVDTDEIPNRLSTFQNEVKLRGLAAQRVADKYGLHFIPLQSIFDAANADAPEIGYWLRDGVHPTAAGHELIKQEWLKAFEQVK